jgi:cytochrome c
MNINRRSAVHKVFLLALPALVFTSVVAHADGDPEAGKRQFAVCEACHTIAKDGPTVVGPNLHNIIGRKAGTLPGFAFSDAIKNSNVVWNETTLDQYLTKPSAFIPLNKMAFIGIAKPEVRANIIAYLKQATD